MLRLSENDVGLFGVQRALNQIIEWINYHDKTQETLDAEKRLIALEQRLQDLEDREH